MKYLSILFIVLIFIGSLFYELKKEEKRLNDFKNLHKYFNVKYNINNPKENIILLDEEIIPDTITLIKAGFQKKKLYYYDDRTATYKEKWEWK